MMVRSGKRWVLLILVLFPALSLWGADSKAAYEAYVAAYQVYQAAVAQHLPAGQVDQALKNYHQAREGYIQAIPGGASALGEAKTTAATSGAAGTDDQPLPGEISTLSGTGSTDGPTILGATFPADVRGLIEALNKAPSGTYAEAIIGQLSGYLTEHPSSPDRNTIKYELARAYERLKGDNVKAGALYREIAADPGAGSIGIKARLRAAWLAARGDKDTWKKTLDGKYTEMTTAYQSFQKTSWLAFPVKIARWAKYLGRSVSFIKAQNDESDFQLWYEALGAPLAPSVGEVFDQYQAAGETGSGDAEARVRLVYGNYEAWYARWRLISEAQRSIDIQYFIIENDVFGMSFLGLILQKAKAGVKIRLMVDARGSNKLSLKVWSQDYLQEMVRNPNIEIKVFNPMQSNLVSMLTDVRRILSSNHDKIVVVDDRYAIIGGRNIANEYLTDPVDDPDAWRDCDIVVDSPEVAREMEQAFTEEFEQLKAMGVKKWFGFLTSPRGKEMEIAWRAMGAALERKGLLAKSQVDPEFTSPLQRYNKELAAFKHMTGYAAYDPFAGAHSCPVKILDKNALSGPRNDITEALVRLIDGSRREILIQNPYIVLTPRAEAALQRAAKRGVPIYIHTNSPQTSDSFPTEGIVYRDWRTILTSMPTCRMFARVNEGQLHAKNFVFDGQIGIVGTYNFDYLSEKVNSEVVAVIKSPAFAAELRREIFADLAKSKEYHLARGDEAEFGPGNIENAKKMWLVKLCSKMGWLKPLF